MKPIFSSLCISFYLFCCFNVSAQKIHITDTSNYWLTFKYRHTGGASGPPGYYYNYEYGDDTVTIDGHSYNQLYSNEYSLGYLIREEGNKVYLKTFHSNFAFFTYCTDTVNEFLYFDYDMQTGDTLTLPLVEGSVDGGQSKSVVESIDSTLINNVWHKIFNMHPISGLSDPYSFTEGIGTYWGPLIISTYISPNALAHVVCFRNNNTNPIPQLIDCDHVTSISDPKREDYFHLYPNPANEAITIEYSGLKNSGYNIYISDLSGRVLLKTKLESKAMLDISNFLSGMYIIQIAGENGTLFRDKIIVRK